ncbi:hypothetical protein G9U51_04810 [Calidifontibacter sp. DB0510]|uniref:N,N-dimethylformamidase beta subunit-like C-terminal domain-containing protein n=1 Tax=Metallococcus carri TaxID=1656884 RepID=A0A967B0E3_9MICO|nr:N,N-dimethylformamidase beta subunit family domain-containing protein [Metallococcus carri]NHN55108.1 hypothetical protein [Metallococcus carri]NOP36185.1 hypothetical protein [Calidifontibacter sp. DB2511S]
MAESSGRLSRRVFVGLPALAAAACSGPKSSSSPSGTPSGSFTASGSQNRSVDWVVAENARPGADWRRPAAAMARDEELCGYPRRIVLSAGEPLELAVRSTIGAWTATVLRVGHYGGKGAREVHRTASTPARPKPQPRIDPATHCVTAGWEADVSVPTDGWPAGAYLVVLEAQKRWRYTTFVIRSEATTDRLALVVATSTWAAYNTWGGYSLYKGPTPNDPRAYRVSHDRPQESNGAPKLLSFEAATIRLAESLGLPVAYVTSYDLEDPARVRGATGIVSLGHDEYWSRAMRDNVTTARDAGTNLAFLGANACYWRIRHEDDGQSVVCYKVDDRLDPVRGRERTSLWRAGQQPEPENSLTGMLYECFPAHGDLAVRRPDSWLLDGTGVQAADRLPGIVGTEVDRAYPIPGTPASLEVVAHSPVEGRPGVRTHSDFTYYRADSGAGVVAVGTMQWTWALLGVNKRLGTNAASVAFVERVTTNLLRGVATRRLGDVHPPRPDLASLGASPDTRTGTGGAVGAR